MIERKYKCKHCNKIKICRGNQMPGYYLDECKKNKIQHGRGYFTYGNHDWALVSQKEVKA